MKNQPIWDPIRLDPGHEYLILRRDLPKPKEQECPELEPGDVVQEVSPKFPYLIMGRPQPDWLYPAMRLGRPSVDYTMFSNDMWVRRQDVTQLYRNGKKLWWRGKLEGQEEAAEI